MTEEIKARILEAVGEPSNEEYRRKMDMVKEEYPDEVGDVLADMCFERGICEGCAIRDVCAAYMERKEGGSNS